MVNFSIMAYPWDKAPDEANFAATNADGIAFWFEKKPSLEPSRWAHVYNDKLAYVPHSPKIKCRMSSKVNWEESLQKRPK